MFVLLQKSFRICVTVSDFEKRLKKRFAIPTNRSNPA
jgi:hypothetical protein